MSYIDRREFLKLIGGSTAALSIGMGLTSREVWAKGAKARKESDDNWEIFYPGKYNDTEAKILKEYMEVLDKANNHGDVNITDVVTGKFNSKNCPRVSSNGMENNFKITAEKMITQASYAFEGDNPLFTDRAYGKKTKYGDRIAFPTILTLELFTPTTPKTVALGQGRVVTSHNDTINYYKPFYEGDTLFTVYDEKSKHFRDITPPAGSKYRTFAVSGKGKTYNQKGELVAEGANIIALSYRRLKGTTYTDQVSTWESPNWWARPYHKYTDKDWEKIIGIWKNEKRRGATTLYWDDVNIGDEPTPKAVGPIMVEQETDMLFSIPQWNIDLKKNILDPKPFAKMKKNKQGIYVLPGTPEKKPAGTSLEGGQVDMRYWDGRAVMQNAVCGKFAAGMIMDWMGDAGWLQRIGWQIMSSPIPGFSGSVIPPVTKDIMPCLFDKYPYMEKVPYMKARRSSWHALENDLIIVKAYVFDKYVMDNEYFVDLTWWCETIDEYIVEEGTATVKLPKRS